MCIRDRSEYDNKGLGIDGCKLQDVIEQIICVLKEQSDRIDEDDDEDDDEIDEDAIRALVASILADEIKELVSDNQILVCLDTVDQIKTQARVDECGRPYVISHKGTLLFQTMEGTADGGVIITGDGILWERKFNKDIHACWFGHSEFASAQDNASALNAAITYANENGGGVVHVGQGRFQS